MRTETPQKIHLKDYAKPNYRITDVDLTFVLADNEARITSRLQVTREVGVTPGTPFILDGDELTLVSLAVNGDRVEGSDYSITTAGLTLFKPPVETTFEICVETLGHPDKNSKLMGLYKSSGVYCTQCEAEGFRRITFFQDRPDILAVYTVRIEAPENECAVLLSNGNPVESGKLDGGRHYAIWHDPHPKPAYLFALVAGNLDALPDTFMTKSGAPVDLNIYVEPGKSNMARYAMDALKRSMIWDETEYGREYDLDVFNIVAVSDFNMGAMENKGLNVFNDKYVLADPQLATDTDYANIEAIIAHEYFHNWTGNRITCRDWFQLCLKEGLTVYRDQEFSADARSRAVQRIKQVKALKASQFPEDAGPLAHPVRPSAYSEINNFYTATVYQKGAELVRMLATLVGETQFRQATDLYFDRHDGEAATVEDFLKVFADVSGMDLAQFALWYSQPGTPELSMSSSYDEGSATLTMTFEQSNPKSTANTPLSAVPIPVRYGLIDPTLDRSTASTSEDHMMVLSSSKESMQTKGLRSRPVVSVLRRFSAPVTLTLTEPVADRLVRARFDRDPYNRWEAFNSIAKDYLVTEASLDPSQQANPINPAYLEAVSETIADAALDPAFRALVLDLPSERSILQSVKSRGDPDRIHAAKKKLIETMGQHLATHAVQLVDQLSGRETGSLDGPAAADRALKNELLSLLCKVGHAGGVDRCQQQFYGAKTMTDKVAALTSIVFGKVNDDDKDQALAHFHDTYRTHALAIDKWVSIQAMMPGQQGLARIQRLGQEIDFDLDTPNRIRSLLGTFANSNPTAFHQPDGSGYDWFCDHIKKLDSSNPQIAARLLTMTDDWRLLDENRQMRMRSALNGILEKPELSKDCLEIVDRLLSE